MDKYPIPAIAYFYDTPNPPFLPITTASSHVLRVNKWNYLYVTNDANSGSSIVAYGVTNSGKKVPISVLDDGTVRVFFDDTPGIQKGQCTEASGIGYTSYDDSIFTDLDTITMVAGDTLNIYGLHAFGNVQALVELILIVNTTITRLLVSVVSEHDPKWDPEFGTPLELMATQNQTVKLRIKALRPNRIGDGTGRIFARLI